MISPHIKDGVSCEGMKLPALHAALVCMCVYIEAGQLFTITSITDGKHSNGSLHYKGLAIDIRTRDLVGITAHHIAELIRNALGNDYDVVVEATHIHVEYDPA